MEEWELLVNHNFNYFLVFLALSLQFTLLLWLFINYFTWLLLKWLSNFFKFLFVNNLYLISSTLSFGLWCQELIMLWSYQRFVGCLRWSYLICFAILNFFLIKKITTAWFLLKKHFLNWDLACTINIVVTLELFLSRKILKDEVAIVNIAFNLMVWR